jgi:cyclopropane fatty-acyl-phospholipid synthase-like methyltransferase
MKHLRTYEKFDDSTLSKNNSEYLKYLNTNRDKRRSDIVAWSEPGSQVKNWNIISKHIKDGDSVLDFGCGIGDILNFFKRMSIKIGNYKGVDINPEFITLAKETYPNSEFQLIKNVEEIDGKYDVVCASGVFTWFITKTDFVKTITKLYNTANKEVLMTFIHNDVKYDKDSYYYRNFWSKNYRTYNESIFEELFPDWELKFEVVKNTLLVRIIK